MHRHAAIPADSGKVVALVRGSVPSHDRVALTDQLLHLSPDSFPHPAGIPADVDARPDLQQSHGEPAAKAQRAPSAEWALGAAHPEEASRHALRMSINPQPNARARPKPAPSAARKTAGSVTVRLPARSSTPKVAGSCLFRETRRTE